MEYLINIILLFFAYAFLGWCIEVTLKFIQFHRFINRGFLTGPLCPIYGCGAVLITVIVGNLSSLESGYGTTFVLSFLICGILEYLTSYVMEKRFHARWWDYSLKPMNLHGRVWIGNLILFGLGGVAIMHIINPPFYRLMKVIPAPVRQIAACLFITIFFVDFVLTHFILKMVKTGVESSEADNTEEISREIYRLLSDKSVFYKRFANAYPDVIYHTERINARIAAVRAETERLRKEAERYLEEKREYVSDRLEPPTMIKSGIISRQDALINMLYDERNATDEMKTLKNEIDREKARLR